MFARRCAHLVEAVLDAAKVGPGVHLLEVGTGPGVVAARALARGAHVTAIEPDHDMRPPARRVAVGAQIGGAAFPCLPSAARSFDAVVANFVLNHVGDPRAGVAEPVRVARPGAWVSAASGRNGSLLPTNRRRT